mmetsp:Transcript_26824/g.61236  ORF Transcript_26824/g.61236 Transcript_26824/m.61236 type:complete len:659 (+) Transcript_26824:249-2225(+)
MDTTPDRRRNRAAAKAPTSASMGNRRPTPVFRTVTWLVIVITMSALAFYLGVWTGMKMNLPSSPRDQRTWSASSKACSCGLEDVDSSELQRRVSSLVEERLKSMDAADTANDRKTLRKGACDDIEVDTFCPKKGYVLPRSESETSGLRKTSDSSSYHLLPKSLRHFVNGIVRVSKEDFMDTFDQGVPPNPLTEGFEALIIYNKKEALPSDDAVRKRAQGEGNPSQGLPVLSANEATENCDTMNIVLTNNPSNTNQCLALVGSQYQSYHIDRWMRRKLKHGPLDAKEPLRLSTRGFTAAGKEEFFPPAEHQVHEHQERLMTYLTVLPQLKSRLKAMLAKMGTKTVVVLTSNFGQSELLINFACNSRSKGFSLNNVIVFPTDLETKELSEGMGLNTFYDEHLMASVPKREARYYGDQIFTGVMFSKVVCVQLVNELGYDVLFQDVDLVWFKDPLTYFHNESLPQFDMYFQDDGSRQERYSPLSANTGFYYVRSNSKTKHFFRHLLYSADLITAWKSHQQVLIQLLNENRSLLTLSVKVFAKELDEFPGGLHYHRKTKLMKKIMRGESSAFIFHMSWTENKDNKVKFFQQMGEWHVNEKCVGREAKEITDQVPDTQSANAGPLANHCCSAEPIIKCHYRDKPSKYECPNSPFIDKKGKSFW